MPMQTWKDKPETEEKEELRLKEEILELMSAEYISVVTLRIVRETLSQF